MKVMFIHHKHFIVSNTAEYIILMGMPVDILLREVNVDCEPNGTMELEPTYPNDSRVSPEHGRRLNSRLCL